MLSAPLWPENWLSTPRFATYLGAARDDPRAALELYEWNAEMSSSVLHDLAHLEVGLRNAYDRALRAKSSPCHWSTTPDLFFGSATARGRNEAARKARETALNHIRKARSTAHKTAVSARIAVIPDGAVVAELPFGFWRNLSTATYDQHLWIPILRHGFQPNTTRKAVDRPAGRLHRIRNRVAHHEPLLSYDLESARQEVTALAQLISPMLESHMATTSSWRQILGQRPT